MSEPDANGWLPIETAPKDGSDILLYCADCGLMLARWIAPSEFLSDDELGGMQNDDEPDWFFADYVCGGRVSNDGMPTHWQALPAPPISPRRAE